MQSLLKLVSTCVFVTIFLDGCHLRPSFAPQSGAETSKGLGAYPASPNNKSLDKKSSPARPKTLADEGFLLKSTATSRCLQLNNDGVTDTDCGGGKPTRFLALKNSQETELKTAKDGHCLDLSNSSTDDGNAIGRYGCNQTGAQKWKAEQLENGIYRFHAVLDDKKCIKVSSSGGSLLQVAPCGNDNDQKFAMMDPAPNRTMIVNQKSQRCLEIEGGTSIPGEVIQQQACNASLAQHLAEKAAANNHVELRATDDMCLGGEDGFMLRDDDPIVLAECKDVPTQRWKVSGDDASGYSYASAANSGLCLEMDSTMPDSRALTRVTSCSSNPSQRFKKLLKDENFVAKEPILPTLEERCTLKLRLVVEDHTEAGRLVTETLGGTYLEQVQKYSMLVCKTLYRDQSEVWKAPRYLAAHVAPRSEGGVAYVAGAGYKKAKYLINAGFIEDRKNQGVDVALTLKGTIVHELTHVYQNSPDIDQQNVGGGYIEAVADAVRIKNNFPDPTWPGRDKSGPWYKGYERTAEFYLYIEQSHPDFVRNLNLAIGENVWNWSIIKRITGTDVDTLWDRYVNDPSCAENNLICGQ